MHAHTHITLSERIFRARIIPTQERDVIFKWFSSLLLSHHFFYYLRSLHSPIHDVSLFWWPPHVAYSHIALSFSLLRFLSFCLLPFSLCFCCFPMSCLCFYGLLFFFCGTFVEDGVVEIFIPLLHFQECCTIQMYSSECPSSRIVYFIIFLRWI